jgi:hypothetical protein
VLRSDPPRRDRRHLSSFTNVPGHEEGDRLVVSGTKAAVEALDVI